MNIRRYLRPESIRLTLRTSGTPDEGEEPDSPRFLRRVREGVIGELVDLLSVTGRVGNPSKLYTDMLNREKRAPTALGSGVAMPHVRTIQAKSFIMAFGRSPEGLPFSAFDGEPVQLFFGLVAPPYEDKTYLRVYQHLGRVLTDPERKRWLLESEDPSEILLVLKDV